MIEHKLENKTMRLRSPDLDCTSLGPTNQDLIKYVCSKYGHPSKMGPSPKLRFRLDYVSADDCYEALVSKLVNEGTTWIDVGCGRDIFPSNYEGAKELAKRAAFVLGIDPDDNVYENDLLSDRFRGPIEDFETEKKFNLVTMRMVAEHVEDAERCVQKLAELAEENGYVVIYTPWKWSPMSIIASIIPFSLHNRLKKLIWNSEEQDTFPTAYRMNTRRVLQRLFNSAGFNETYYWRLDDCSVTTKFLWLNALEIRIRNILNKIGFVYPENCILAVFRRVGADQDRTCSPNGVRK